MRYVVFGYNFPHWKTQAGLQNLVLNGFPPAYVVLQDKKDLNIPKSDYRITPKDEYLIDPKDVCKHYRLPFFIQDHDDLKAEFDFGVILGARILKQPTIDKCNGEILNIHPAILPGNRGLDNLKWSIIYNLPIGVTAHWIDKRIDMGYIISSQQINIYHDDTIRDLYIRQRNLEQEVLINCMKAISLFGLPKGVPCEWSEKFSAVPAYLDFQLNEYFLKYKDERSSVHPIIRQA